MGSKLFKVSLQDFKRFTAAALVVTFSFSSSGANLGAQSWGLSGKFGLAAPAAWKLMTQKCEDSQVVIAVIDTGIDTRHPSLLKSLWTNSAELKGRKGFDDDGNGFVDDIYGWDFVKKSGDLSDTHGHGTHISGIIAASESTEGDGFVGVCPGAKILSLRYYDPNARGDENLNNTVKAIEYAVAMKVDVINYSGGGNSYSSKEFGALKKAEAAGILVVAAAGNETNFSDEKPYYPASYSLSNIISVAALNESGFKLARSNFGMRTVHLAAPGQSVLSTLPGGSFGYLSGTSQATAFVSGLAAMILTEGRQELSKLSRTERVKFVKEQILAGSDPVAQLQGLVATQGRASAEKAIRQVQKSLGITTTLGPATRATSRLSSDSSPTQTRVSRPRPASEEPAGVVMTYKVGNPQAGSKLRSRSR